VERFLEGGVTVAITFTAMSSWLLVLPRRIVKAAPMMLCFVETCIHKWAYWREYEGGRSVDTGVCGISLEHAGDVALVSVGAPVLEPVLVCEHLKHREPTQRPKSGVSVITTWRHQSDNICAGSSQMKTESCPNMGRACK